jgi:hypothetical protein
MPNYCPNCSEVLAGRDQCTKCRWSEKQPSFKKQSTNHRCAFENNGQRCPLTASLSTSLNGKGRWFCRFHFSCQDDPIMSANVLDDIVANNPDKNVRDWRDDLVDQSAMALGKMDKAAKIDTLNFMREVIKSRNS